jgi:hypothetical protein
MITDEQCEFFEELNRINPKNIRVKRNFDRYEYNYNLIDYCL